MRKSSNAAKAAFVATSVVVDVKAEAEREFRELPRSVQLERLGNANQADRMVMLGWLGIGQLASLAGDIVRIGSSIYEAIHLKLCSTHGNDWYQVYSTPARDLCDADKERKKRVVADLDTVRDGIKAGNGGDALKAADAMRKVRDWGSGKHKSKSAPNANKKQGTRKWLMTWDVLPTLYRRLMSAEDIANDGHEMELADAIAAYLGSRKVNEAWLRELKGKSEYVEPRD